MKHTTIITVLVFFVVVAASFAATVGILSEGGPGLYELNPFEESR